MALEAIALLQSRTHCHIPVDLLSFSTLLNVFKTELFDIVYVFVKLLSGVG